MPAVAEHPKGKALCYQSLDNKIVTYNTTRWFRQNRKKTSKGHLTCSHACWARFQRFSSYSVI
jgi:pre-mRNA-processing factor 17